MSPLSHSHPDSRFSFRSLDRLLLSLLCILFVNQANAESSQDIAVLASEKTISRIAFGSCLKDPSGGKILDHVAAYNPDLFIWLGDNVYIDTDTDTERFQEKYDVLGSNPRFMRLRKICPNLAVWDDHDYGNNDVGMRYPLKELSKKRFGEFWEVPKSEPFWKREGIYRAYEYGPVGQRVQIILVDGRWFRDKKNPGVTDSYLGAAQWSWLEKVLARPAELRLICSGVQVIRINANNWEMVGEHPGERQRLFDLITETKANGVVFISGDMHFAEIHRTKKTKYPYYDVTSSGMDTVWKTTGESKDTGDFEKVGESLRAENFGSITINWKDKSNVHLQLRDNKGSVQNEVSITLEELSTP